MYRQRFTDAEEGIHAAFGIGRNQHQAFAGGALRPPCHVVRHARLLEVPDVDGAVGVVGDLAGHIGWHAELGRGDHRVAGATAAGVTGLYQVALQQAKQLRLTGLIHQRHQALVDPHGGQFSVLHLDFGVDQGCTHAVDRVFLHLPVAPSSSGGYYPDPPVK